jgi:peptide/nickel transport system substrate-binding protein
MKKYILFLILALVLTCVTVFISCGGSTTTTSTATSTTPKPTSTAPAATTTAPAATSTAPAATSKTTAAGQPVSGGTLRVISSAIPKNLGYTPEKAPSDNFYMLPAIEHLCEWGPDGGKLVPVLATSWESDHTANTITWHFRQGVKFTDGTPFNADAVRWNMQLGIDAKTLTNYKNIDSLEVKDNYTLVMHMKSFDWQSVQNYGLVSPISPTSFLTAGGTIPSGSNNETSKAWARAHAVGTGPFTVSEWVRDDHITFVKNPNYWQPGKPYLDKIILRMITDPAVADASLEAGEADIWNDTSSVQYIKNLQSKGFKLNWGPGMFNVLLMSSANKNNPLSDVKVRQAIEYALDRPTIAQTLGQGLYEPLTQMAPKVSPAYVQGYDPRPFNTDKAKQLLAGAGYPNGLKMKMLGSSGGSINDVMALFVHYLGLANITITPDIADLGRYFGALFNNGPGWDDICFTASGINPDASDIFVHYGPSPMTFRTTNMYKSDAYVNYCNQAISAQYASATDAKSQIQAAVKQAGEDCLFIPLWRSCEAGIMMPYVHTEYPKIHGVIWDPADDWMDKH